MARVVEYSDDQLSAVAQIIGNSSAASRAMAERDRRRSLGEDAVVYWDPERGILWVGPRMADGIRP